MKKEEEIGKIKLKLGKIKMEKLRKDDKVSTFLDFFSPLCSSQDTSKVSEFFKSILKKIFNLHLKALAMNFFQFD